MLQINTSMIPCDKMVMFGQLTGTIVLEIKNLAADRGGYRLFEGVNFQLDAGRLMQLVGPNGAGKTTLLFIVAGLLVPANGQVRWNGQSVLHDRSMFAGAMSYLGHAAGLKASLDPVKNLQFLLALRGKKVRVQTIHDALNRVGLYGYECTAVGRLSAGQKRRVALARLYLEGSPLWVLDEPFTAIDLAGVGQLEQLLVDHARQGGMILFTTHHVMAGQEYVQQFDLADFRHAEEEYSN